MAAGLDSQIKRFPVFTNIVEQEFCSCDTLLFRRKLPIEEVGFKVVPSGAATKTSTTTNVKYNMYTATVDFKDNFVEFSRPLSEEEKQNFKKACFPIDEVPTLVDEASTKGAFLLNVLIPLLKILNLKNYKEKLEQVLGSFVVDLALLGPGSQIIVAIEIKTWHSFLQRKLDELTESNITKDLQDSIDLRAEVLDESCFEMLGGEDLTKWRTRLGFKTESEESCYENLLCRAKNFKKPDRKETDNEYKFRMGIKKLRTYLFEMKREVAYGMLSSYCHTYFVILQRETDSQDQEKATLKISPVVNYSDKDFFKKIFEFVWLAVKAKHEHRPLPIVITKEDGDMQGDRMDGNLGPKKEENKKEEKGRDSGKGEETTRDVKGDNKRGRQDSDVPYTMGDVLGSGRSGCVLEIFDAEGHSFAAKRVGGRYNEEVITHELKNERAIYKKLKDLQGKVLPRLYFDGYFNNCMYTLVMDMLDADPIWNCNLSYEQKTAIVTALEEIHKRGVLHGDIRSDNILIDRCNPKHAYFIDFALSTECNSREDFEMEMNQLKTLLRMV